MIPYFYGWTISFTYKEDLERYRFEHSLKVFDDSTQSWNAVTDYTEIPELEELKTYELRSNRF